ncbi:MerR family transcriptional regulator [soil metagenome]
MRSGALARLARVTVRALRHYHRVGVLAEPDRGSNGYRAYDVHDLIRVLRIKRLAALGIPLARMPALLDEASDGADEELAALDSELAAQIDAMTRQRSLIARLREQGARPDLPPELAPFLAVFAGAGLPSELAEFDRDQSVLLAHLAGEDGMARLAHLYERLTEPELVPAAMAVSERFARLGPDSTAHEVHDLIESAVAIFAPVIEEFDAMARPLDLGGSESLLDEYAEGTLNARQRALLEEVEARIDPSRST